MCKSKGILLLLLLLIPVLCWSQQATKAKYEPGVVVFKIKQSESVPYAIRELSNTHTFRKLHFKNSIQ